MDSLDSKMDSKKNAEFWECKLCNFKCSKKSNYNKHLSTLKHNRHFLDSKKCQKMPEDKWSCECGKTYKFDTGFYRHKKKCNYKEKNKIDVIENDKIDYKGMLEKVMEENAKLMCHIGELIPKIGNNNTINNKQKININIFLNEQCRDAISMNEFIDKIKVNIDNLLMTKNKGISEGVQNIFIENMNKLSLYERPMHCTDPKRETIYIKNETWEKDTNNSKLKEAIKKIGHVQQKSLDKWTEEHPNWMNNPDEQSDYLKLIKTSTDDICLKEDKIIKKVCSNVYINEDNL